MAALLNSLQMGFKTLAIQKHSSEVWDILGAVKTEFDKFGDVLAATQNRINQLRKAANEYMDESLRQTEEVIVTTLNEVRDTRMKFRAVTEAQEYRKNANVDVEV